jgi:hypothetical protein
MHRTPPTVRRTTSSQEPTPPQRRELAFFPTTSPTMTSHDTASLQKVMDDIKASVQARFDEFEPELVSIKKSHEANLKKIEAMGKGAANSNISDISENISNLEKKMHDLHNEFEEKLKSVISCIGDLSIRIDDLDQARRSKWLVIQGLSEVNEATARDTVYKLITDKLQVDFSEGDNTKALIIDDAYRMGKRRTGAQIVALGPRPVLVKFSYRYQLVAVLRAKKKLKNSKIFISESLTPGRLTLLKRAREKFGARNAWSSNGHILVNHEDKIERLTSLDDIMQ